MPISELAPSAASAVVSNIDPLDQHTGQRKAPDYFTPPGQMVRDSYVQQFQPNVVAPSGTSHIIVHASVVDLASLRLAYVATGVAGAGSANSRFENGPSQISGIIVRLDGKTVANLPERASECLHIIRLVEGDVANAVADDILHGYSTIAQRIIDFAAGREYIVNLGRLILHAEKSGKRFAPLLANSQLEITITFDAAVQCIEESAGGLATYGITNLRLMYDRITSPEIVRAYAGRPQSIRFDETEINRVAVAAGTAAASLPVRVSGIRNLSRLFVAMIPAAAPSTLTLQKEHTFGHNGILSFQLDICGQMFPSQPVDCTAANQAAHAFEHLVACVSDATEGNNYGTLFTRAGYVGNSFIIGINLDALPGAKMLLDGVDLTAPGSSVQLNLVWAAPLGAAQTALILTESTKILTITN